MSYFTNPLHIDFVITFQDERTTTGYWFMTSINGPMDCKVWFKAHDGWWYIAGSMFFDEKTFSHSYQGRGLFLNSSGKATLEEKMEMDRLLNDHLSAGDYPHNPYIYWPNAKITWRLKDIGENTAPLDDI